jgi:DNA replication protein DnaC
MNTQHTIEKMRLMRMKTMADIYHHSQSQPRHHELSADELLTMLVDAEWEERQSTKISNLLAKAGFRARASASDLDYQTNRNLDKTLITRLLTLQFVKNAENVIITGPTGVGKSYIGQLIGNQACQLLITTRYYITARFFDMAKLARLDGTWPRVYKQIQRTPLLILDDFGLHAMDQGDRQFLLDIIEQRHQVHSTIICSQIPVSQWHAIIGDGTIADAILDRLVYSSHRIELNGESLRKKQNLKH